MLVLGINSYMESNVARFGQIDAPTGWVVYENGDRMHFVQGVMHCVDGPAVILEDGTEIWYQNNKRHRVGGPAVVHPNGTKEWYQNGFQFRDDDLPTLECADGTLCWEYNEFLFPLGVRPVIGRNSGLHRIGGPAVIRPDGTKEWWYYNVCHRQDGPAVERPDGTKEWWIWGRRIGCPETC